MKYGKRIFEGGKVHEITEETPGFINRWIKRGCTEVKEEVDTPKQVKPFRKKSKASKKPKIEKVEEEVKEVNNIEETKE